MKKLIAIILVLMLTLAAFAGCANNETPAAGDAPTGDAPTGDTPTATEAPGAEAPADPAAEAKTNIRIAIDADISTLHPANTSTTSENRISCQIYDTLNRIDFNDRSVLVPMVAESWEISDDGLCYTYHLRNDITFHNGTPLTAADIAFSIDLYAASEYQGAVVEGLDHYEIVDDYTIKLYTTSVYAPFLQSMASMFIASKAYYESVDEETFAQQPVGCGPYKFVSHDAGDKVTLAAYDEYYMGAPVIKDVVFKVIGDVTTMAVGLQTGEIDYAEIDSSVYTTLKAQENVTVEEYEETTFCFIAMNHEQYPYNEVAFRQAINYAVDRENLVMLAADGLATPNSNLLIPQRFGYSESQLQYTYDVEKAKELLTSIGLEGGYDLGVMYVAEQYSRLAQVIQNDLANIGLTVQIEILEFNAYLSKLMAGECGITCLQMSLEGDTQQVSMALCTDYIGMANNARYSNAEMDELFAKAVTCIDENERFAIYDQIFSKVQNEAIYCVLYNPTLLIAHTNALKTHPIPLEGTYYVYNFAW